MTLRVGLVGCGWATTAHLAGWIPEQEKGRAQITAINDVDASAVERVKQQVPEAQVYDDFDALIREAPVDAVDITLPHHLHLRAILASIKAGKHWLCEKPLCLTLDEAQQIESAMKAAPGLVAMCAHNQLHMPSLIEAKRLLDEGALGRVYMIMTNDCFLMSSRKPGVVAGGPDVMPIRPGTWRADAKQIGGGELIDTGYHPSYMLTFLAGEEPERVAAIVETYRHGWFHGEDTATVLVRYPSGATGQVRTSWAMRLPVGAHPFHVVGERGELYGNHTTLFLKPTRFGEPARWEFKPVDSFAAEVKHFVDCVVDGATCVSPYEQGIAVLRLILKAYESAKQWKQ